MSKRVAIDGNRSIAEGVRLAKAQVVAAYPITPSNTNGGKSCRFYK